MRSISVNPRRRGVAWYGRTMRLVVSDHHLTRFQSSLDRCLGDPVFLQRFYARFLLADEAIAARFARTDLKKQAVVLRSSIYLVLRAAQGHDDGVQHLRDVGRTHSSRGYGITAAEYGTWLRTLLEVAREIDHEFDPACEEAWRACLEPCIAILISGEHA